jgi:hypothetical protein
MLSSLAIILGIVAPVAIALFISRSRSDSRRDKPADLHDLLSEDQRLVIQREIALNWFNGYCEKCGERVDVLPIATEDYDALCGRCRLTIYDSMLVDGETVLGSRRFVDDAVRPVFQSNDGRQFVFDDDGERVFGFWLNRELPDADECVVVHGRD